MRHSEHGESLKSRKGTVFTYNWILYLLFKKKPHASAYSTNISEFYRRKRQQRHVISFRTCSFYKGCQARLGGSSEFSRWVLRLKTPQDQRIWHSLFLTKLMHFINPYFCHLSLYFHCLSSWLESLTLLTLVTVVIWNVKPCVAVESYRNFGMARLPSFQSKRDEWKWRQKLSFS